MQSDFFQGKRVLVTGGTGLIGSAFVGELLAAGALVRTIQRRRPVRFDDVEVLEGDLLDPSFCRTAASGMDAVVHAAGTSGGSKHVTTHLVPMFTETLLMGTQMLEAARWADVGRFLFVSNSSVYAKSEDWLREEDAWGEATKGIPENETGMVKRVTEMQCALYARHTGMQVAIVRAGNAYGPWDNFDLESSHVVPALIRKAVERQNPFQLWGAGDTVRDFIHTRDIARGGLFLLERHAVAEPVNVATGRTVTIRELAELIIELSGGDPDSIRLDPDAPPASPAKRPDISHMLGLGFEPSLSLEEGLGQTIEWYRTQQKVFA